jgi:serine protease Do
MEKAFTSIARAAMLFRMMSAYRAGSIGRHRVPGLRAACLAAALLPACAGGPGGGESMDIRRVIAHAKDLVFPCIVYVKPIREEFSSGEKVKQEVFGSGVIISPDGLVVTNDHVVEKATRIQCVLFDERQVDAKVVGEDPETDLALLRLELPEALKDRPLPAAAWGDSSRAMEGDFVMALGSPFGFTRSISLGIVSNTRRYIGFQTRYKYSLWLQTDAAINPGNSGGPLVNTDGEIIGINTLGTWAEGIGFAIPSNTAREVIDRLRRDGKVLRAWTGIELQPLMDFEHNTFFAAESGVKIASVEEGSPAQDAGLRGGDLLLQVGETPLNGRYVEDLPAVRKILSGLPTDRPVIFRLRRGEPPAEQRVEVSPVGKGKLEGEDFDCERWNMTVKEISKFGNPYLAFYRPRGVYVQGVKFEGNAAESGLLPFDILLRIEGTDVRRLEDVKAAYRGLLAQPRRDAKVLLEILRKGQRQFVVLDYARDRKREREE